MILLERRSAPRSRPAPAGPNVGSPSAAQPRPAPAGPNVGSPKRQHKPPAPAGPNVGSPKCQHKPPAPAGPNVGSKSYPFQCNEKQLRLNSTPNKVLAPTNIRPRWGRVVLRGGWATGIRPRWGRAARGLLNSTDIRPRWGRGMKTAALGLPTFGPAGAVQRRWREPFNVINHPSLRFAQTSPPRLRRGVFFTASPIFTYRMVSPVPAPRSAESIRRRVYTARTESTPGRALT